MKTPAAIARFLAGQRIALVGVSRDPRHFSRMVLEAWAKAGYTLVPVHPAAAEIAGRPVFASLVEAARDAPVDGALVQIGRASCRERVCHRM